MIVIGIAGKKGSGKDATASMLESLCHKYSIECSKIAFADALKEELFKYVLEPNGIPKEALHDDRKRHFRLILQGYGTDFKRDMVSKSYWTDKVREYLEQVRLEAVTDTCLSPIVIVTDVRFQEEYDLILDYSGTLIRINRYNGLLDKIKKFFKRDKHSSECALDKNKFHCVLDNSGTYEQLEEKVESFFSSFLLSQEM